MNPIAARRRRRRAASPPPLLLPFVGAATVALFCAIIRPCLSVEIDRVFVSGAADTSQLFRLAPPAGAASSSDDDEDGVIVGFDGGGGGGNAVVFVRRHHLVCFHRGGGGVPYAESVVEGRKRCCKELYLSGLLIDGGDDWRRCQDRVALVPEIGKRGVNVVPAFYLAVDEPVDDLRAIKKLSLSHHYEQSRQLKVYEDNEKETLRDVFGVGAFSPFHLKDFTTDGLENNKKGLLPLTGAAGGTLSDDGGMHRAFRQSVRLWMPTLLTTIGPDDSHYRMNINATILLPLMESVFIDADDPLISDYDGDGEKVACRVSIDVDWGDDVRQIASGECDINFAHPETIDIEQPAFASRQHVVAYRLSASLDLSFGSDGAAGEVAEVEREEGLGVTVDYGTVLHVRYPPPITSTSDGCGGGSVPVAVQQPVLYSASASLTGGGGRDAAAARYALQTSAATATAVASGGEPWPDPLVIRAAAGLDSDYWLVTVVTMSSALVGGWALMRSLDSVSAWS